MWDSYSRVVWTARRQKHRNLTGSYKDRLLTVICCQRLYKRILSWESSLKNKKISWIENLINRFVRGDTLKPFSVGRLNFCSLCVESDMNLNLDLHLPPHTTDAEIHRKTLHLVIDEELQWRPCILWNATPIITYHNPQSNWFDHFIAFYLNVHMTEWWPIDCDRVLPRCSLLLWFAEICLLATQDILFYNCIDANQWLSQSKQIDFVLRRFANGSATGTVVKDCTFVILEVCERFSLQENLFFLTK